MLTTYEVVRASVTEVVGRRGFKLPCSPLPKSAHNHWSAETISRGSDSEKNDDTSVKDEVYRRSIYKDILIKGDYKVGEVEKEMFRETIVRRNGIYEE